MKIFPLNSTVARGCERKMRKFLTKKSREGEENSLENDDAVLHTNDDDDDDEEFSMDSENDTNRFYCVLDRMKKRKKKNSCEKKNPTSRVSCSIEALLVTS